MIEITTELHSIVTLGTVNTSDDSITFSLRIRNTSDLEIQIVDAYCKVTPIWVFFSKIIKLQQVTISLKPNQYIESEYSFSKILEKYPNKKITICVKDSNGNIYTN